MIDGETELYTKSVGRDVVLAANLCGCTFPGRPLVEGTGSLNNFSILAGNAGESKLQSYKNAARELIERVMCYQKPSLKRPRLLVLHASNRETSNTMAWWSM
ncbi:MAG: NADPH-dependent oxidoreductase, partial [Bacillota bacterium]